MKLNMKPLNWISLSLLPLCLGGVTTFAYPDAKYPRHELKGEYKGELVYKQSDAYRTTQSMFLRNQGFFYGEYQPASRNKYVVKLKSPYIYLNAEEQDYYAQDLENQDLDFAAELKDPYDFIQELYFNAGVPDFGVNVGRVQLEDEYGVVFPGRIDGVNLFLNGNLFQANFGYGLRVDDVEAESLWFRLSKDFNQPEDVEFAPLNKKGRDIWDRDNREKLWAQGALYLNYEGDVPLGYYGGRTWAGSSYHVSNNGSSVYYDRFADQYFLEGRWANKEIEARGIFGLSMGSIHYFNGANGSKNTKLIGGTDPDLTSNSDYIGENDIFAQMILLQVDYYDFERKWVYGGEFFYSTGSTPTSNPWSRSQQTGYYEMKRGGFGTTGIYFNGLSALGDGHSINNVNYIKGHLEFDFQYQDWPVIHYQGSAYFLNRTKSVSNADGNGVSFIGLELDNDVKMEYQKDFLIVAGFYYFMAGSAYSPNDNLAPQSSPQSFAALKGGVEWSF